MILENEIKTILNINEFPLNNYFLKEENNLIKQNMCYYDKIYMIKYIKNNISNSFNKEKSVNIQIEYVNIENKNYENKSNIKKNDDNNVINKIIINNDNNNQGSNSTSKIIEKFNNFETLINQMENNFKDFINQKFLELNNYGNSILKDLKDN